MESIYGLCAVHHQKRVSQLHSVNYSPQVTHSHGFRGVLVLDAGRIIEYDTPQNLLQQKGAFSEMVAEAGIRR